MTKFCLSDRFEILYRAWTFWDLTLTSLRGTLRCSKMPLTPQFIRDLSHGKEPHDYRSA
jgi:hypothetical protein